MEALKLLNLSLFLAFTSHLVDAFALFQRLLLLLPYALLVAEKRWMP